MRGSIAPAAIWRTGSRNASSIFTPIADRTSTATIWANQLPPVVLLDGLCPAVRPAPRRPPRYRLRPCHLAAPSVLSCSRSERSCASVSDASKSPWRRPDRLPRTGAAPPSRSPPSQRPAQHPHDTCRRGASMAAQSTGPQRPGKTPATTRALRRHPPPRLTPTSLQNYLTRRKIHQ